jgi:diacylglycerol kinase (ATP)
MAAHLIVNPVAGSDAGIASLPRVNERLRRSFGDLDITVTTGPGDAEAAAARAAQAGAAHLFVAGGDGTLNEALNGIARTGRLGHVVIGLVPLGTGNDFAGAIGIPEDLDDALAILDRRDVTAVDIGLLDDRVFVNVSAGGFVAEVSDTVSPALKTVAGKLAYLIGGAQVLFDFEPIRMTWQPEGEWHVLSALGEDDTSGQRSAEWLADREIALFAVCNSRLIGGGRLIAPHALIDDGWLDVCVIEAMPTLEFVGLLRQVAAGEHVSDPRVGYARVRDVTCAFDRMTRVNTDGQVLEAARCRYRVRPKAVRMLTGEVRFSAPARPDA